MYVDKGLLTGLDELTFEGLTGKLYLSNGRGDEKILDPYNGPIVLDKNDWREQRMDADQLRRDAEAPFLVRTNGKHFSYLGTPEEVFYKVSNFMLRGTRRFSKA